MRRRALVILWSGVISFYLIKVLKLSRINPDFEVEKILKGSLDLIPSPSPSVKIQITGGKVSSTCKGKTLLGVLTNFSET